MSRFDPQGPKPGDRAPAMDLGACPTCGRDVAVVLDPKTGGPAGMTHVMPMCPSFQEMGAGAFFAWVCDVRHALRQTPVSE